MLVVLAVTVAVVAYYLLRGGEQTGGSEAELVTGEPQEVIENPYADRTEEEDRIAWTIDQFYTGLFASSPMNKDDELVAIAMSVFTEGGRAMIPEVNGEPHLAQFLGVQDFPDRGYEIESITIRENEATGETGAAADVRVIFKYSGGDISRMFLLTKTDGEWKIDGMSIEE